MKKVFPSAARTSAALVFTAVLLLAKPCVPVSAAEGTGDLCDCLFLTGTEIQQKFKGLEEFWSMGVTTYYNDEVSFSSAIYENGDVIINGAALESDAGGYSLLGVTRDMGAEETRQTLMERGFSKTAVGGMYVKEEREGDEMRRLYFDNRSVEWRDQPLISLTAARFSVGGGMTEVSGYLGRPLSEVGRDIPGLSEARAELGISLWNEEVSFLADHEGEAVTSITVRRADTQHYCLFGLVPGVAWDEAGSLTGLGEGGSGELVDPLGNTLDLYYSNDPENPCLSFFVN